MAVSTGLSYGFIRDALKAAEGASPERATESRLGKFPAVAIFFAGSVVVVM